MRKHTSTYALLGLIILVIIVIGGMLWVNYKFYSFDVIGTDFYIYWYGTRALLVDGLSPYGEDVVEDIETHLINNKLSMSGESSLISMPLYAIIITMPFAMIEDFKLAGTFWLTAQEIALIVLTLMMLKITNWRPRLIVFVFLVTASLFSIFAIDVLISGNMIIWTALFFILALGALQAERDELAGGILSLTTFQPHVFLFVNVFILIWAALKKRWLFVVWFLGLIAILTIIAVFLINDWFIQYLRILLETFDNPTYTSSRQLLAQRWPGIGIHISWVLTIFTVGILIAEWWLARLNRYRWFFWTVCLTLVLYRFIGVPIHLIHNLILFIPLLLVMSVISARWQIAGSLINGLILFGILVAGWFFLSDLLFKSTEYSGEILFFVLPILILIALYWVRWWAIHDSSLFIQELLTRE